MNKLTFLICLTILGCSNNTYQIDKWLIKLNLAGPKLTVSKELNFDSVFKANYIELELPKTYCNVEKYELQPSIRILDKYIASDTLNFKEISDFLFEYLETNSQVLSSKLSPSELGQNFTFVIQQEGLRLLYDYYFKEIEHKYFIFEYKSTFGTRRKYVKDLATLMKNIEPIKNIK